MSKTIWFFLFITVCLVLAVVYFAVPSFKAGTNEKLLTPASIGLANFLKGIYASPFWMTWIKPNANLLCFTLGIVATVAFSMFLKPKLPKIRQKQTITMSAPSLERPSTFAPTPSPSPSPSPTPTASAPLPEPKKEEATQ
mgnify:FL=1